MKIKKIGVIVLVMGMLSVGSVLAFATNENGDSVIGNLSAAIVATPAIKGEAREEVTGETTEPLESTPAIVLMDAQVVDADTKLDTEDFDSEAATVILAKEGVKPADESSKSEVK